MSPKQIRTTSVFTFNHFVLRFGHWACAEGLHGCNVNKAAGLNVLMLLLHLRHTVLCEFVKISGKKYCTTLERCDCRLSISTERVI